MPIVRPFPQPQQPGPPVYAVSTENEGTAVWGSSQAPGSLPQVPQAGNGTGVYGSSGSGVGVYGSSVSAIGVQGTSESADAVQGTSASSGHAGVSGINDSGGFGVWARGSPAGHFESSKGNCVEATCTADYDAVVATTTSPGHAAVAGHNNGGGFAFWGSSDSKNGTGIFARGATQAAQFVQTDSASTEDAVVATAAAGAHAAVAAHNTGGGYAFWGASDSGNGTGIYARGKLQAAQFDGAVHVNGTLTASQDIVLGADCAEDFAVTESEQIEPGTVMVLTEDGALERSRGAYDRKVAGVISGAGDCQPGLILGRREVSPERMPLALVGKVYCKVDAQYGPIEIGDLLTTSPTPGHAMRADDPSRSFGAVIGKALRARQSGQGLIPILVALV